ncbi:MAG: hypothetical protein LBF97_02240 [Elusimicrobiota bacterium]|jgi:hypothetical protein|nr:hypothetical protein [Elusimicrobiota bacterium]
MIELKKNLIDEFRSFMTNYLEDFIDKILITNSIFEPDFCNDKSFNFFLFFNNKNLKVSYYFDWFIDMDKEFREEIYRKCMENVVSALKPRKKRICKKDYMEAA